MKITLGVITRLILIAIVIINLILKASGHQIINVTTGEISSFVEVIVQVAIIITCWWKNNSLSKDAIMADKILQKLKNGELDIDLEKLLNQNTKENDTTEDEK